MYLGGGASVFTFPVDVLYSEPCGSVVPLEEDVLVAGCLNYFPLPDTLVVVAVYCGWVIWVQAEKDPENSLGFS